MEKDIEVGKLGAVKLSLGAGKAVLSIAVGDSAAQNAVVVSASASASIDAGALVDMLFAEIEAKSPAGAKPIEDLVKLAVKNAILSIQ